VLEEKIQRRGKPQSLRFFGMVGVILFGGGGARWKRGKRGQSRVLYREH